MQPEERIARLEAFEAIRQLASRYAAALDRRDMDAVAALFVPDVNVGDGTTGRAALATFFDRTMRRYGVTFHLIGNHVIDLVDEDHATGVVYCRPEHEIGDLWVVMPMQYWDRYERRDGEWLFKSRKPLAFYAADVQENPLRNAGRFHFPGNSMIEAAALPEKYESWRRFHGGT